MAAVKAGKDSPPPNGGEQGAALVESETVSSNDVDDLKRFSSLAPPQGGESAQLVDASESQNNFSTYGSEEFPEEYRRPVAKSLCFEVYLCIIAQSSDI